jgi:hypothetical protein
MKWLAFVLIIGVSAGTAWNQPNVVVNSNVQLSSLRPNWEHNEVILSADPTDPQHLLAASMFLDPGTGDYSVVTYVSFDSGSSWSPTLIVGGERGHYGDPATAFGCDGTAYSVSLKSVGRRSQWQTLVYRSPDGGKNWLPPTILPFIDREYISVDCTNSKYRGRIYLHGNRVMQGTDGERISGSEVFCSEDGGKTFSETIFTPSRGHVSTYQGNGVVLSDGTYLAPFTDLANDGTQPPLLQVIRSDNGGGTFSKAIKVARRIDPPRSQMGPVSFDVDRSEGPFRDRIYAVWTDGRSGRSEILLTYSSDKGSTWSSPIVVNDDQPFLDGRKGPDDFMGTVAVNQAGIVGVTWYDRRESANNLDWSVRFAASLNGGQSFSPSLKISHAAFSHDTITSPSVLELSSLGGGDYESPAPRLGISVRQSRSYFTGGDTAGLAASADGLFHALWIDNRTGVPQVWTAAIKINGNIVGSTEQGFSNTFKSPATDGEKRDSRGPDNITSRVIFEFSEGRYDSKTETFFIRAHLVNTSSETLIGRLVVTVKQLRPEWAEIINSDNRKPSTDAIFDFSSLVTKNELAPGERTPGKLIKIHIRDQNRNAPVSRLSSGDFPQLSVEVFRERR